MDLRKTARRFTTILAALLVFSLMASSASAQVYIHANGGTYYTSYGPPAGWYLITDDGYCVQGRGPCSSGYWYLNYTYNVSGCGFENYAKWDMAALLLYPGDTYAWIDDSVGSMPGADYSVSYNYASSQSITVNQGAYDEQWATVGQNLYRTAIVWLTDGWGNQYICNGASGYTIEFDEIKLEI